MVKPRRPFVVSLIFALIGGPSWEAVKAIWGTAASDFWKDTAKPFLSQHIGPWSTIMLDAIGPFWGGVISAFALMFVVEMVMAWRRRSSAAESAPEVTALKAGRAVLRLRFSGQLEQPVEIDHENIRTWFAYWSPGGRACDQFGVPFLEIPSGWAIFISFIHEVEYKQILANFTGNRPQVWQVRQVTPLSAVLTIDSGAPECEMEVITRV